MSTYGQRIGLQYLTILINDICRWNTGTVFRLDNDFLTQPGLLIRFYFIGYPLNYILEFHFTRNFRYDNGIERVPLADNITFLQFCATVKEQFRTIRDICRRQYNLSIRINNTHFSQTAYDNHYLLSCLIYAVNGT